MLKLTVKRAITTAHARACNGLICVNGEALLCVLSETDQNTIKTFAVCASLHELALTIVLLAYKN